MIAYWFTNQVFMSGILKWGILSILWKRSGLRNWNSAGDLNFYQGLFQFPAGLLAISAHPWTKGPLILAFNSSIYQLFLPFLFVGTSLHLQLVGGRHHNLFDVYDPANLICPTSGCLCPLFWDHMIVTIWNYITDVHLQVAGPSRWSFASGWSLQMIICKWLDPPNHQL